MPVSAYEQTVKRVNVGYDLVFTLTHAFLRALKQPALELLVVGAGGGMEIEQFLPGNPGWHLTGVEPSRDMLALAEAKTEQFGLHERVRLVRGTVEDLPASARFDAATCLYVLHFLPDAAKLALLQRTATLLQPDAPLLVATGTRVADSGLSADLLGTWQQYGELLGMPSEQMAETIASLVVQQVNALPAEAYVDLLHQAGFTRVASVFQVLGGGLAAWIAR